MRNFVLSTFISATLAVGGVAEAADGNWSGFYGGGNAGYAWGNTDNTLTISDAPIANCHFCAPIFPGPTASGQDAALAQASGSPAFNPRGFSGGAQIGYNWQTSNLVFGAEIDFGAFSQRQTASSSFSLPGSTATSSCIDGGVVATSCAGNFSTSVKADWLLTVRPRIGYAWGQTLAYLTGGLAVTHLSFSQSYSDNINIVSGNSGGSITTSSSQTKLGWVVGGGFEQLLAGGNWSIRAEYLYVRFDGLGASGRLSHFTPGVGTDYADFSNSLDHFSSNIVRVGLNYRFGAPAP